MVRRGWDWMRKYGGWLKKGGARERRPYGRTSRARESNGEEISDLKWLCRHRVHLRGRWNGECWIASRGANSPLFWRAYIGRAQASERPYGENSTASEDVNRAI